MVLFVHIKAYCEKESKKLDECLEEAMVYIHK